MSKHIMMIHGMFGSAVAWQEFVPLFEAQGYQCHTPTLRYHHLIPPDKPHPKLASTSLLDYAQDLEDEILDLNLDEKPIILGHSMGGILAQILASRNLASQLILLNSASPAGINALKYSVIKSFAPILLQWKFWKKSHRIPFKSIQYSTMNLLTLKQQQQNYQHFGHESGQVAHEIGFWYLDKNKATTIDASKITCRTLVIASGQDKTTPPAIVKKIAKKYQAVATYKEFPDHAHWIVGEPHWKEVPQFILQWLK